MNIGNSRGIATQGAVVLGATTASLPAPWGGTILVQPDLVLPVAIPAAGLTLSLPVPAGGYLCGVSLSFQGIVVDPGAANGIANTAGLQLVLGI
ncbi:MAG TPA: hypothetical protein VK081_14905 [Planctomycetota bacterium]|nr:hypothetical protein [Planctomycetota bacterium]